MIKPTVELLAVKDLVIDLDYRRDTPEFNFATAEFDPNLVGLLTVSVKKNGLCYVIDGWRRVKLAYNNNVEELACWVYRELTLAQEWDLFVVANSTRFPVSKEDLDRARKVLDNPT